MDSYGDTEVSENKDRVYGRLIDTYKIITFAMGVGMVYPNPKTNTRRIVCILLILLSVVPFALMMLIDIYNSLKRRDILNIVRHSTIVGPFLGVLFKMFLMYYKKKPGMDIINNIDSDYLSYNSLPQKYKLIVNKNIDNSLFYSEKCWALTVLIGVLIFPLMATVSTVDSFLIKGESTKYMIHDLVIPFMDPEDRFKSPVFEIMFAYTLYACMWYFVSFFGYDGFFGLCINHACLKMALYCKAFDDALKEVNEKAMHKKIVEVIHEQNNLKRFVDLIQETFNFWLGVILIATITQTGTVLYLISEGHGLDLRYIVFLAGTTLHIFVPCQYSAKLKQKSQETATLIYCAGWENVTSTSIRKIVQIMINRAQKPIEITAFNLFIIDMDLFVRLLNSSYSMYTLLHA